MSQQFPYLYDIIPEIRDEVMQPETDPADDSFFFRELVHGARYAERTINTALIDQDVNYRIAETTLSVAAGDTATDLPQGCIAIVAVKYADSSGNPTEDISLRTWASLGKEAGYIWLPTSNQLRWTDPGHGAFSVHLVYVAQPPPLAHGIVRGGGTATIVMDDHEMVRSGQYVGLDVAIVEGVAAGQSGTANAYNGFTKLLTFEDNFTVVPEVGDIYSSAPNLPLSSLNLFITLTVSKLLRKTDKPRSMDLLLDSREQLRTLKATASIAQRHQPKRVIPGDATPVGDPLASVGRRASPGAWGL